MTGCLYLLTFPSGKGYIGITRGTAEARLQRHKWNAKTRQTALYVALRKHGDTVLVRTLAIADFSYLEALEQRAITAYQTKVPNGYNMTDGGEVPVGLSAESLARIGAAAKGNKYRLGATFSDQSKSKMRAAKVGKPLTKEHRRKIVEALYRRVPRVGFTMPEDVRAKIAASNRGQKRTTEQRANISRAALVREERKRMVLA